MQEEVTDQPPKNKSTRSKRIARSRTTRYLFIGLLVIALAAGVYTAGYKVGQSKSTQQTATIPTTSAPTLPATGEVSKVRTDEITIKLLGKETRTAKIDTKTKITNGGVSTNTDSLKVGAKVVLFTKTSGDNTVATRIIIQ